MAGELNKYLIPQSLVLLGAVALSASVVTMLYSNVAGQSIVDLKQCRAGAGDGSVWGALAVGRHGVIKRGEIGLRFAADMLLLSFRGSEKSARVMASAFVPTLGMLALTPMGMIDKSFGLGYKGVLGHFTANVFEQWWLIRAVASVSRPVLDASAEAGNQRAVLSMQGILLCSSAVLSLVASAAMLRFTAEHCHDGREIQWQSLIGWSITAAVAFAADLVPRLFSQGGKEKDAKVVPNPRK